MKNAIEIFVKLIWRCQTFSLMTLFTPLACTIFIIIRYLILLTLFTPLAYTVSVNADISVISAVPNEFEKIPVPFFVIHKIQSKEN